MMQSASREVEYLCGTSRGDDTWLSPTRGNRERCIHVSSLAKEEPGATDVGLSIANHSEGARARRWTWAVDGDSIASGLTNTRVENPCGYGDCDLSIRQPDIVKCMTLLFL